MSGIFESYAVFGLLNGQVFMSFNDLGGLPERTINGTSQQLYNDGEIHRVNFTFDSGELGILVDNVAILLRGKGCNYYVADIMLLSRCLLAHIEPALSFGDTTVHPPTLWLGGVPETVLPSNVPRQVFSSLGGCVYNATHSLMSAVPPVLLTAQDSVATM